MQVDTDPEKKGLDRRTVRLIDRQQSDPIRTPFILFEVRNLKKIKKSWVSVLQSGHVLHTIGNKNGKNEIFDPP